MLGLESALWLLTSEASGIFRIAHAVVLGDLRVWAQGARSPGKSHSAGNNACWGFAFFHPLLHRGQGIEVIQRKSVRKILDSDCPLRIRAKAAIGADEHFAGCLVTFELPVEPSNNSYCKCTSV